MSGSFVISQATGGTSEILPYCHMSAYGNHPRAALCRGFAAAQSRGYRRLSRRRIAASAGMWGIQSDTLNENCLQS